MKWDSSTSSFRRVRPSRAPHAARASAGQQSSHPNSCVSIGSTSPASSAMFSISRQTMCILIRITFRSEVLGPDVVVSLQKVRRTSASNVWDVAGFAIPAGTRPLTMMRYLHATDQGKRGAIVVLSEYKQNRRHKFSQMKNGRSFNLPQIIENNGEPWRARTSDPLIKSQLLYQLSYRPLRVTREKLYVRCFECQASTLCQDESLEFKLSFVPRSSSLKAEL